MGEAIVIEEISLEEATLLFPELASSTANVKGSGACDHTVCGFTEWDDEE
jgi:hypothetical protein